MSLIRHHHADRNNALPCYRTALSFGTAGKPGYPYCLAIPTCRTEIVLPAVSACQVLEREGCYCKIPCSSHLGCLGPAHGAQRSSCTAAVLSCMISCSCDSKKKQTETKQNKKPNWAKRDSKFTQIPLPSANLIPAIVTSNTYGYCG